MLKEIFTENAPKPIGPYSQAIEVGSFVFCSGQVSIDPKSGNLIGKTAAEQMSQAMTNLKAVLQASGLSIRNIVKTTIFLKDIKTFQEVNSVYEKSLEGHRPARSTIEVSALPKDALVEVECIAYKNGK